MSDGSTCVAVGMGGTRTGSEAVGGGATPSDPSADGAATASYGEYQPAAAARGERGRGADVRTRIRSVSGNASDGIRFTASACTGTRGWMSGALLRVQET